jgi:tRNA-specific 2-thiouridylase
LTQAQLAKALFPIGELTKPEVRKVAKEIGLTTADKKDSQGLCFIGKVHLPEFLQQKLETKKGRVIEVPEDSSIFENGWSKEDLLSRTKPYPLKPEVGTVLGEHNGAHYYTIGQRKGLNMGGFPKPLFVIGTDTNQNVIYMGQGENHPGLYRNGLFIDAEEEHWVRNDLKLNIGESRKYKVRIRYRQPLENAELIKREEGTYVLFDNPQRGVAPGQFAAWYEEDELIGSGVIS